MSIPGTLETVVELLGLALLHFLWQGLLLWLLFVVVMRLLAQAPAVARYYCALVTLGLMLLTPAATFWWLFTGDRATPTAGMMEIQAFAVTEVTATVSSYGLQWLPWVAVGWFAGVLILAVRMILDARYLLWLKRSADTEVPAALAAAVTVLCRQLQLSPQRIGVAITPHVSTALVVGWLRPVVLLPAAIMTRMPQQQLELVLAHELAHIRRFDPLVNFLQAVTETLLFYHPMVSLVSRRIRVERENCTDDLVVSITHNRIGYARALTALEELRDSSLRLSVGVVDGDFSLRIRRLFRATPRRQKGMLGAGLVLVATTLLALLAGLGMAQWPQQGGDHEVKPEVLEAPAPTHEPPPTDVERQLEAEQQRQLELQRQHEDSERLRAQAEAELRQAEQQRQQEEDARLQAELERQQAEAARREIELQRQQEEHERVRAEREQVERVQAEGTQREGEVAERRQADEASGRDEAPRAREPKGVDLESALAMVPARPGIDEEAGSAVAVVSELTGGRLIHMEPPEYPSGAMRRGVEAEVRLSFVVDAKGRPRDIEVLGGDHERYRFGPAAVRAVQAWRFEPFAHDGRPVERRVEQVVAFNLPGDGAECAPRTGTRINARRDC